MKAIILYIFLVILPFFAFAHNITPTVLMRDNENDIWHYEKVINIENTSQKDIYDRLKLWVLSNVKTGDVNNLFDDKNMETIITTPTLSMPDLKWKVMQEQLINFKLKIEIKDNKIRVSARDFVYYGKASIFRGEPHTGAIETLKISGLNKNDYKQIGDNIDRVFIAFIEDLEKNIRANKSDW